MAEIKPFRGLRFDPSKVDLAKVLTPPYDVISEEQKDEYYLAEPHNVIRVILGREQEGDDGDENCYTRSREYIDRWRQSEVLIKDEDPAIYRYDVTYPTPAGELTRSGFMARLRVREFEDGIILPHEHTFDHHREDRLRMLRATNCNLSPIFVLYDGGAEAMTALDAAQADFSQAVPFGAGAVHSISGFSDPAVLAAVERSLADSRGFIADGHHRYETALHYSRAMKAANPNHTGQESYNYVLACLTPLNDPGLTVFPTHRVARNIDEDTVAELPSLIAENMKVEELGRFDETTFDAYLSDLQNGPTGRFIFLLGDRVMRLSVENDADFDRLVWKSFPPAYKRLDVTVLHEAIIERHLGKDWYNDTDLAYIRKDDDVLDMVLSGRYQMAFFMKATPLAQMVEIASMREVMPPKSTYFYPKLLSGVAINEHD